MGGTDDLKSFVAIDFETTGTDPEHDEIIELGAVQVRDGQLGEHFDCIVSPAKPIPHIVTRLTGISTADCDGQPPLSSVFPEFLHFLGDEPIVAHNAPFDLSFLNRQLKERGLRTIQGVVFDTLELSRIILPRLKNHQLPTLLQFFSISSTIRHRACADAEHTAKLFLTLLEYICHFDLDTLQTVIGLTHPTSPLHQFFLSAVKGAPLMVKGHREGDHELTLNFDNVRGEGHRKRRSEPVQLDPGEVEGTFRIKGKLGTVLSSYEERGQQREMARAVALAFNQSEFLIVEAGTGVGKTLAYLVPAIKWALASGERILISTKTKNLQEQLFYNDIPLLQRIFDETFKAVLLKGRTNYLCLNKWYRILMEGSLSEEERRQMLLLVIWVKETLSGDITENTSFRFFQNTELWNKVCAESTYCLGGACKYRSQCFYQRVRSAAQSAHLVVTNHALLFSDAQMDHMVLDTYSYLILDEAHNVERIAAQHFGAQCSVWRVRQMVNRLYLGGNVETGLLVSLLRRIERAATGIALKETLTKKLRKAIEGTQRTREASQEFFTRLTARIIPEEKGTRKRYRSKFRYGADDQLFDVDISDVLFKTLKRLSNDLALIYDGLSELSEGSFLDQVELTQDIAARSQECQELMSDLSFLLAADDADFVYWLELPAQRDSIDTRLFAAPLEVGALMNDMFYRNLKSMVLTSGTLTVNSQFDYMMERLGLDGEKTVSLQVGSPFDFDEQSLVCVPAFLSTPKGHTYQREIKRLLEEVVLGLRRGTMALFTSYDMLQSTHDHLKEPLEREGVLLLGQGLDGSRSNLLNLFKEERGSVLMGTESFWEGVDVPGEALEVLILTKLPFAVPTEPMVAARMELYQRRGMDPFLHYSVPEAVMKFKQGFGRLIRSRTDRGVVLICDTRVLTSTYGPLFLASLPTRACVCSNQDGLLAEMKQWLELKTDHQC